MTTIIDAKTSAMDAPKELMKASRQWAERPDDERYDSIESLLTATRGHRERAATATVNFSDLRVEAVSNGGIEVLGRTSTRAVPTHWAFGQLAARAGAPAKYLRTLPSRLVADCLNNGISRRAEDDDTARLLIERPNGRPTTQLRAVNGERYARIWNHEIAQSLLDLQSSQPHWQFPEAFRRAGAQTSAWGQETGEQMPTAFASDHDLFVFLCDYAHPIQVPGADTQLSRGFFVENSEVGASAYRLTLFLFDFSCCNLIVWGARNVVEVSVRHVGDARDRVLLEDSKVRQALRIFANTSASETEAQIASAQRMLIADTQDDVVSTLYGRRINGLTQTALKEASEVAKSTPRYGDPRSIWAMVNGLTEVSQRTTHANKRIDLDRAAGKVMEMAF